MQNFIYIGNEKSSFNEKKRFSHVFKSHLFVKYEKIADVTFKRNHRIRLNFLEYLTVSGRSSTRNGEYMDGSVIISQRYWPRLDAVAIFTAVDTCRVPYVLVKLTLICFNKIHKYLIIITSCYSLPLHLMFYKAIYDYILPNHACYFLKTHEDESMVIWIDLSS